MSRCTQPVARPSWPHSPGRTRAPASISSPSTARVNITDCVLDASLQDFTPEPGQGFPIITSTAPIVGTFAGLPEGAPLTISGVAFTISYVGGSDHNDIVLTQAGALVATQLVVTNEPPDTVNDFAPFGMEVSVEDGAGHVNTGYTGLVVLALASGTGTLGGTTSVNAVNGIATFSDLTLSPAGIYTIGATSDSLTPATSTSITVAAPPARADVGVTVSDAPDPVAPRRC